MAAHPPSGAAGVHQQEPGEPAAGAPARAVPRPPRHGVRALLNRAWLLRISAHVATWVPFFFGVARSIGHGWVATSDNSIIALRAWDVLSTHGPLVGQATRFGFGVFDLGPLEYWLLTIPVHLDAGHGVLWGAALWCMLAASLTVEAAWSVGREYLALAASAVVLGVIVWIPAITALPDWNPWFGIMFLLAALTAAWAVMAGRRGWWGVAVITASIAAQSHLMFAIGSVGAVAVAAAVGLYDTARAKGGYRWAVAGVIAGLACWAAPLFQEVTAGTGNMTALVSGQGAAGTKAGLGFGLKGIAAATEPPAYWWKPLTSLLKLSTVEGRPAVFGIAAIGAVAAVLLIAVFWLRSRLVAGLAALALVMAGSVFATYSDIRLSDIRATTSTLNNLRYLLTPMYPLGVLAWLSVICAAILLARRAFRRAGAAGAGRVAAGAGSPAGLRLAGVAAGAVLIAASAGSSASLDGQNTPQTPTMKAVGAAARQIQREILGQPVALKVSAPGTRYERQLTMGLAYILRVDGYRTLIGSSWGLQLGSVYELRGQRLPLVLVTMRAGASPHSYAVTVRVRPQLRRRW